MINNFPIFGISLHFRVDFLFVINLRDAAAVWLGLAKITEWGKSLFPNPSEQSLWGRSLYRSISHLQYFSISCFCICALSKEKMEIPHV